MGGERERDRETEIERVCVLGRTGNVSHQITTRSLGRTQFIVQSEKERERGRR